MRVAEIMNDFRALQYHIANLQANPRPEEYYLEGYSWLRHSVAEAQAVLAQDYNHDPQHPQGDAETEKSLLKLYGSAFPISFRGRCTASIPIVTAKGNFKTNVHRIIIDASIRRFQCQWAYMRAVICSRWVDARNTALQGLPADPGNAAQVTSLE